MKISSKYPRVICTKLFKLAYELSFLPFYAKNPQKYPITRRYSHLRQITLTLDKALRLDSHIEGYSHLLALEDSGINFLMVSNHLSDYDALKMVSLCSKPISFVAKEEAKSYPFVGKAIASMDGLFLPRSDLRASLGIMKSLEERLLNKENFLIYPEGTRNKKPFESEVAPFHPGSFKGAMKAKVVILPVAVFGTFNALKPAPNYKRTLIQIKIFKPIYPQDYEGKNTEEIATLTHEMINNEVTKMKEKDIAFYEKGYQKIPLSRDLKWK